MRVDYILGLDPAVNNFSYCLLKIENKSIAKHGVFDVKDSTYEGTADKLFTKLESLNLLRTIESPAEVKEPTKVKAKTTTVTKKKKKRSEDDVYINDYSNKEGKNVIVVIEYQIGINSKTVNIVGQMFMYFAMYKHRKDIMNIVKVVTYPAKEKLKYYVPKPSDPPMPDKFSKLKKGHYYNKQLSIEHCRRVMKHNNEDQKTIEFFESCSKKDDLSDSYLESLAYAKQFNLFF